MIDFVISEGTRYRVGAVDFKGVTIFPTNEILRRLKMPVGAIFTPKGLQKDVDIIQDLYGAKGYIGEGAADRVGVIAHRNANTQTGTMDITYEIEEGQKSIIEKIEIKGNTKTKDRVIRRELAVSPGEVFDTTRVKLSKDRLDGLNDFEKVDTRPEDTDVRNRKNLAARICEYELWLTARSNLNFRAQRTRLAARPNRFAPLPPRPLPPCPPITAAPRSAFSANSTVWAKWRAEQTTSWPRLWNSGAKARKKGTCGEFARSIQIRMSALRVR